MKKVIIKKLTKKQAGVKALKIKTSLKFGGFSSNHNQSSIAGLRQRTSIRAAGRTANHNQPLQQGRF